ncbi:MAG: hypothetical protein HY660_13280 [Armatimonadetes bacterium]|nr:hypothetical protein [Armatimonadota bacterium]
MEIADLLKMSQTELDDLFKEAQPGAIPSGDSTGMAIACPGTFWARLIAKFVKDWAWQGKVFTRSPDGKNATLQNKITAAGVHLIAARVYYTQSWLDGKECIVLDYSKTSLFARKIRDEIRLIDPEKKIYLGKVWWGRTRLLDFALQFPK